MSSKMNVQETEKRLGLMFCQFEKHAISASQMLADAKPEIKGLGEEQVKRTKEKVFGNIIESIEGGGYPAESEDNWNNAMVRSLVAFILLPILSAFRQETGRSVRLQRGDRKVGDTISANFVTFGDRKLVFIVEAAQPSIWPAKRDRKSVV